MFYHRTVHQCLFILPFLSGLNSKSSGNGLWEIDASSTAKENVKQLQQQNQRTGRDKANQLSRRPNILLLLTDDQDVLIGGTEHMPLLNKHLVQPGVTFKNAFVHTPICCPSRSSILTGLYLHNGGAYNNSVSGNCNGEAWQLGPERNNTFAVHLQTQYNYRTGYAGKYLNQYGTHGSPNCSNLTTDAGCHHVPPGWDYWMGLRGNSRYYNYTTIVSNDGGQTTRTDHHGNRYAAMDYFPDLIANRTLEMINKFSQGRKQEIEDSDDNVDDVPFLIVAAWPTPHSPFTPAPQDRGKFDKLKAHRTPNFNTTMEQNAEKQWLMRQCPPIDDATAEWIDSKYQARHEALLTIDRQIEEFTDALENAEQLDNTYIIYTSDNGWQFGQHRLRGDKRHLYEHDIRVPMIVRVPAESGISKALSSTKRGLEAGDDGMVMSTMSGRTIDDIVLNIDIAPTIVDIASRGGLPLQSGDKGFRSSRKDSPSQTTGFEADGRSFLPLMLHDKTLPWREDFLVSYHGEGKPPCGFQSCPPPPRAPCGEGWNNTYNCVRTKIPGHRQWSLSRGNTHGNSTMSSSDSIVWSRDSIYCRFDDDEHFVEYYDLEVDPWQLHNAVGDLTLEQKSAMDARLAKLKECHGQECRI